MTAPVAALLFGSGLCALVYQVAWLRELRLIFGASTAASAAVLAVFMGGLGVGGLVLGRRAATRARPLQLYGNLELGIALSTAATPLLVTAARWAYSALGGTVALGLAGGTVVRLALSALVLCVPTFLMGGTLPAAAQAVEIEGDVGRRRLAVLYGVNTLGAVAGCLLSTFLLLEVLGIKRMLWAACALNALIAMAARALSRRGIARDPAPPAPRPAGARTRSGLILLAAAIVGFAFLLMELVWYRMLAPLLGGSSYTFGLILAVALLGIGLGGGAYALFGGRRAPTLRGFAVTCAAEAACIALPYALGDRLATWAALLRPLGSLGFSGHVAGWSAITVLTVLPAAFVSGVQFPLLIALLGKDAGAVGRQVGLAYAWNTAGAILGSLAGGFGLLPLLSAPGAWRAVVILLAGLCLGVLAVAVRRTGSRAGAVGPFALAMLALALLGATGPTAAWRHGAVGAGRAPATGTPNVLRDWANGRRRAITWQAEGVESSVAINSENGHAFVVNGKIDGNARSDAPTQVMSGLLGALLHPNVRSSLVIGLGTGSTAGWLGAVPSMERVDVAELEPAILHVARVCAPVNQRVLDNPKVHVFLGDARELLLTTRARYDLIFSEPSNPYRAGISSLFTQDFYRAAEARLADGGLFVQWVQAYAVDAQTVRTAYATLESVFPEVETWVAEEGDLLLVAGRAPLVYDLPRLRARVAEEPYRSALEHVWRVRDVEGLFAHHAATSSLARAIARVEGDELSTDDLTLVEFGFARGVGRGDSLMRTNDLRETALARGDDRPVTTGGALDWDRVAERRVAMLTAQTVPPSSLPYKLAPAPLKRQQALDAWLDNDWRRAVAAWRAQPDAPDEPVAETMLAESLAELGDEAALPLIDRVRAREPVEADAFLARLRLRQGRIEEATQALESSLRAYRTDPWPLVPVMRDALRLAPELAKKSAPAGERLYALLEAPFEVALLDGTRRDTRIELAQIVDFRRLCAAAFLANEPWPVWQRDSLLARYNCYSLTRHPLADVARRELGEFSAVETMPFASGLTPPK